jgi:ParB-like chromosome segregation protein Spo0J
MNIKIDPEFRDLIPPLSEVELKQLHDNITSRGCLTPLVVWKEEGILLDGHNRYAICKKCDYEYDVKELKFPSRDQAKDWVILNQLGRRNINPKVASYLRGKLYISRKKEHGGDRKSEESSAQNEQLKTDTAELIARQTGVSRATIVRDAAYAEACETVNVTTAAMASGEEKRSRSEIIATARPDKDKPKKVVKTPYEKILTLLPSLTSKELQDLHQLLESKF